MHSSLQPALFIHPEGLNRQEAEAFSMQTLAAVLDQLHGAASLPLTPTEPA